MQAYETRTRAELNAHSQELEHRAAELDSRTVALSDGEKALQEMERDLMKMSNDMSEKTAKEAESLKQLEATLQAQSETLDKVQTPQKICFLCGHCKDFYILPINWKSCEFCAGSLSVYVAAFDSRIVRSCLICCFVG